jgi:hypothetical protein
LGAWVDRYGLAAILALFVALGIWYSLATPPFETPDELYHYAFARHLAQGNPLPVQAATATGPWEQEGSQAPLYYWIVGRLTAGIDQSDFERLAVTNPRSNMGDPLFPGNKNRMLYSAAGRPLVGTNLALHVARWFSLLLGAVTLGCVAYTARLTFAPGSRLALLPPLLLAVIPQFVFISASCSNDPAVIAASAAVVAWLARILVRSAARPIRWIEWAVLGALLGLAALSKLQGLGLFVLAAGAGVAIMARRRQWSLPLTALLPVALPATAIAGWWYWRNVTLYGDWFGLEHLVSINGQRTEPLDWGDFWLEFRGLRYSFWGLFGWFSLLLPRWFYHALDGVTLIALAGAAAFPLWSRRPAAGTRGVRWLLVAWLLLSFALVVYWINRATGSQGRLFFPAIGAAVILLVAGLDVWLRRLPRPVAAALWTALVALLLAATIYAAGVIFPAAYGALRPLAAVPATAQPVNYTYGDTMYGDTEPVTLLAIDPPPGRYSAGEWVPVTLYLTAAQRMSRDVELFIQLLDETGAEVGNVTTHPGWGRFPTTLWTPGAIYADTYQVQVRKRIDPASPLLARIYTGFVNPDGDGLSPLTARDSSGAEVTPMPAQVVLVPWTPPDPAEYALEPLAASFAAGLDLRGLHQPATARAGETLTVTLLWQASAAPGDDLAAFVHVLDAGGQSVAGFDRGPGGERFPTRVWAAGDQVVSRFAIPLPATLPPGDYSTWVGLYPAASAGATRVPVVDSEGTVSHDMVELGRLRISP